MKPLHATRILDLTRLLPGAVCTMLLRDLGTEIIKIEDPNGGDYARWMPPLIDGLGAFFRASNRGKRSIVIDLKTEAGQAILHKLVASADVLIEGFRPGVTTRLGADYETLRDINPQLVFCSLSGWGQDGPDAQVSGHDLNYIARNGVLGAEQNPRTPGAQLADVGGAYVAVMGVLAALLKRQQTGAGDYIDVALAEAAMPFAMAAWVEAMSRQTDEAFISLRGESACYKIYFSSDGQPLALGAIEPKFWANFCRAVGKPKWIERQRDRQRQPQQIESVAALFRSKPAAEWSALLEDADCCFTGVIAPEGLRDDPQIQARGMVGVTDEGAPWMRSPVRLGGDEIDLRSAPAYGAHTRELLAEIGYATEELDQLIDAGVIRQAP